MLQPAACKRRCLYVSAVGPAHTCACVCVCMHHVDAHMVNVCMDAYTRTSGCPPAVCSCELTASWSCLEAREHVHIYPLTYA